MAGTTEWKAAFKKGSSWGTAVAVSGGDGFKLAEESMPEGIPEPIKDENVGDAMTAGIMQGNVSIEGSFAEWVRFERLHHRLALFLGEDSVTEVEAGKVYEHAMRFRAANAGLFGTLVLDKGLGSSRLWEYPSVKLSQIERSIADGKAKINWTAIANKCERDSANQASHDVASLTFPQGGLVIFNQLRVYLKEVTGSEGNMTAADEFAVTDAVLTANRNLSGAFVTGSDAGLTDEPETDGLPEGQLKLSFSRYTAGLDDLLKEAQKRQAGSKPKIYKASLVFTGPTISGASHTYLYQEDFASLVISSAPVNASGPGAKVPVEITFDIITPEEAPNGTDWNWVVAGETPFRVLLRNTDSQPGA